MNMSEIFVRNAKILKDGCESSSSTFGIPVGTKTTVSARTGKETVKILATTFSLAADVEREEVPNYLRTAKDEKGIPLAGKTFTLILPKEGEGVEITRRLDRTYSGARLADTFERLLSADGLTAVERTAAEAVKLEQERLATLALLAASNGTVAEQPTVQTGTDTIPTEETPAATEPVQATGNRRKSRVNA